jgi:site-specific DNA-methyltransferase (adenine-specific)
MELNKIYCMDNVEGMKKYLPDGSIDLTVTSPPYDNLRKYEGFTWDFEGVAKELLRVTKVGGVVVWVVNDATINGSETLTSLKQAIYFKEIGFNVHDTMIYRRWSGVLNHKRYEQEFEYMFVFTKGKISTFNPIMVPCKWHGIDSDRTGQKYVLHDEKNRKLRSGKERNNIKPERIDGNIWDIRNSSQRGERYGHPAPFPEELARRHILSWSNEGDLVFDPFVGSGTTCRVAKELKRNYLGFDVSKKYIAIAKKRVNETKVSG